jgi:hypothetical protein
MAENNIHAKMMRLLLMGRGIFTPFNLGIANDPN